MTKLFCSTLTAFGLLLGACGGDKGDTGDTEGTTTATPGTSTSTNPETTQEPDPTTTNPGTTTTGPDPDTTTPDPSTSTTDPDPDTTNSSVSTTTVDPSTTTTTEPGTTTMPPDTTEPGDPVEQCKMMADPMTACSDCVCENCLEQLQACQMNEGCVAIRMCAEETGCTGFDCLQECGDVIDMYGGIAGESAMIGLQISMCLDQNCADACG